MSARLLRKIKHAPPAWITYSYTLWKILGTAHTSKICMARLTFVWNTSLRCIIACTTKFFVTGSPDTPNSMLQVFLQDDLQSHNGSCFQHRDQCRGSAWYSASCAWPDCDLDQQTGSQCDCRHLTDTGRLVGNSLQIFRNLCLSARQRVPVHDTFGTRTPSKPMSWLIAQRRALVLLFGGRGQRLQGWTLTRRAKRN